MFLTLASTFMTATRMDGFAHAAAEVPARRSHRSVAARALAALKRLAG